MKKILRFAALGLIAVVALAAAFAVHSSAVSAAGFPADGTPTPGTSTSGTPTSHCGANLACIQAFGYAEIDRRDAALNAFIAKVTAHKNLTSAQSSALISDANSNISGLSDQRTLIKNDTTVSAARTDVENIYKNFRIFAVVLPRDYGEIYLDLMTNLQSALTAKEPAIQSALQEAQNEGINITQEQGQLTDLESQVTNAGTQLTSAQGLIASLIPANYPGTDATIAQYHTDLKAARGDLGTAATDLKDIISELKAAGFTKSSGTPTTVPTPSA